MFPPVRRPQGSQDDRQVKTLLWRIAADPQVRRGCEQNQPSRICKPLGQEHAEGMTDRDDFLAWVKSTLYEAELAIHNGDTAPRRAIWSRNEPLSILGAWRNAYGQHEVDEAFTFLERSFSDCTSYTFELQAYEVVADMAYTAGLEHISTSIDGQPRSFTLRATQVYRREDGEWKVAHRDRVTVSDQILYSAWAALPPLGDVSARPAAPGQPTTRGLPHTIRRPRQET
jgi:hypothetical protein